MLHWPPAFVGLRVIAILWTGKLACDHKWGDKSGPLRDLFVVSTQTYSSSQTKKKRRAKAATNFCLLMQVFKRLEVTPRA